MHAQNQQFHPGPQTLPNLRGQGRAVEPSRDAAGLTHPGGRERNEDQFLVADIERRVRVRSSSVSGDGSPQKLAASEGAVLVVADGMGGHGSGDLASAVTVDGVLEFVVNEMPWHATQNEEHRRELVEGFGEMARVVQERLFSVAARKQASPKLGTTLTIAYLLPREVFIAHVGDSRCYLLRNGYLTQLTEDHTLAKQAEKAGAGDLSHMSHILVNAIGGDRKVPRVDGMWAQLQPNDRLMLCSDGLSDAIDDARIQDLLGRARNADEACHLLVRGAVEANASDNVTVVSAFG